jgi:signal transduction histidine kinase/CheY-like chemotaxis protein
MEGMRLVDTRGDTLLENAVMERLAAELAVPASSESAESFADRTADPGAYRHSFLVESDPESETVGEYELADSGRVFQRRTTPVRDASGGLIGRLVAVREITSEREVDRLKDEFVATVSHELRTPLASILGYLSYLMRGKAGGFSYDQGRYLEVIDRNAGRLLGLVNDLLFVARMDAGTVALELEPLRLDEVVADSVQTSVPLAREKGIELVVDNGVPLEVAGDRGRLAQVVENLLSNAVKFTPGGGRVTVRALVRDGRAVLEVEDSGIGIPDSERQYLFRRFFRASTATARKIQGTGLGLSIAKTIVELHAGTIAFQSREGEGTTFRVELPLRDRGDTPTEPAEALPAIEVGATLAETHEQPGEAANDEASHQPEATGVPEPSGTDAGSNGHCAPAEPDDAGRRNGHAPAADRGPTEERPFVVIADDDRDVRELLALELRGLGYEVAIVGDGREALERIRARHPDACVLDWMMPVASGPEVCEQLKADPGTAGIPVVLLTARATQHDVTRGFEYGADDYLTKPFEVEELDQALRRLLHPHARV